VAFRVPSAAVGRADSRHSHKQTINSAKWSPDGHLVATAGGNGQVQLFDIRTFRELDAMKGHTQEVNCESRFKV